MKKFSLMFVRHGQTNGNIQRVFQALDTPLNETGQSQAVTLGKFLKHEKFTHIYCSDLTRTRQTCELIMSENEDFNTSPSLEIISDERLREKDFGDMRGCKYEEYDLLTKKHVLSSTEEYLNFKPPGGESLNDVTRRCKDFFTSLCEMISNDSSTGEANIIAVTHGQYLQLMFSYLYDEFKCEFEWGSMLNTGRSCFEITLPYSCNESDEGRKSNWIENILVRNLLVNIVC